MSAQELADRLASLSPAQRALYELALKKRQKESERPAPPPTESRPEPVPPAPSVIPRRPHSGPSPLSFDQERLWRIQRAHPRSPVYNICAASRFRGRLDVGAFTRALQETVRRHESLRTTFREVDGRPVQEVAPSLTVHVPVIDLRALPWNRREDEAFRAANATVREPFDIGRLPLFRIVLIQVDDDDFVRPIVLHHMINDHLSFYSTESELLGSYLAFRAGGRPDLPEPPFHLADFAVWQRDRLRDEALVADQLSWWRERLDGIVDPLPVPLDRPRPAVPGFRGERRLFNVPRSRAAGLGDFAQSEGVTLFVAGLAVFDVLLVRLSGQERLIAGTPMSYRQAVVDHIMGFYLSQVPIPVDLSGNPPFREAVRRVRDATLGAHAHQDLPLGHLIQALHPGPDRSFLPWTQFVFLLLYPPKLEGSEVPGIDVRPYFVDPRRTQFDTQLALFWRDEGITGFWEYNPEIWDPTTVDRFKEYFRILMGGALADPGCPIWDLPMLSEGELHQLQEWSEAAGLQVLDRHGRPVPIGVVGEIHPDGGRAHWLPDGRLERVSPRKS